MKKRQVVLYIIVMIIMLTTSVYATISAELSFEIKANSKEFYPGDEFTIAIGLKNINCEQGIKSIEGYIDIDENVLEELTVNSIVTEDDGKVHINNDNILPVYDANSISSDTGIVFNTDPISQKGDYKIVINLNNPINENINLVTFKFKVKNNVAPGNYSKVMSYKLFTIFSENATEKLELNSKSYKIEISDRNNPVNNTTNTPKNSSISDDPVNNAPVNNAFKEPTNNAVPTPVNNTSKNPTNNATSNTNPKPANNTSSQPVNNTSYRVVNNGTYTPSNYTPADTNKNTTPASAGTTGTNKTGVAGTTSKQDSTISASNLPKTGYRTILFPIIVISIVGLVFYKKYSKYNSYHE